MEEKILYLLELAVGIIAGFTIWSFIAPSLTSVGKGPNV